MTGRVCEIHGEWSADGICRWCEPTEYDWTRGPVVESLEELARVCNVDEAPPLTDKLVLEAIVEWQRRLASARLRDDVLLATYWMDWLGRAEEDDLAEQHAALRWERVARKWNYKHREPDGLDEVGRAYIWRAWLSQVDRIYRASLHEEPP